MVDNFLAGGAAINVFARANGLGLKVVDAGVAHDFGERDGLIDAKVAPGTQNYIETAAMTPAERDTAIARGAALARELSATGCRAIGFGEMGIGNTAAACLLITHHLTGTPSPIASVAAPASMTPVSPASGHCSHRRRRASLPARNDGSSEHTGGARRVRRLRDRDDGRRHAGRSRGRMLLLIDGFIVGAAFSSRRASSRRSSTTRCSATARRTGHQAQLKAFDAEPLIDLGLRLGEGTGAALAWPLVRAAAAFLNEMASFESAGVAEDLSERSAPRDEYFSARSASSRACRCRPGSATRRRRSIIRHATFRWSGLSSD